MSEKKQIELLVYMMEDIRKEMLEGVEHLTKEQLFAPPIEGEFPIGAYLMHFAEVDLGWLATLSEGKVEISDDIKRRAYYNSWFDAWGDGMGEPPAEMLEKQVYFDMMAETRKMTIDFIKTMSDDELEDVIVIERNGKEYRYVKKWIIYHLIEHEAHTRGQMFMLIRKAGWNKK